MRNISFFLSLDLEQLAGNLHLMLASLSIQNIVKVIIANVTLRARSVKRLHVTIGVFINVLISTGTEGQFLCPPTAMSEKKE